MKLVPKMHRLTSIAAGILILLSQMLSIASWANLAIDKTGVTLFEMIADTLIAVLLAVILFRGKKDVAAGVGFLIVLISPLISMAWNFLSILAALVLGDEDTLYFAYSAVSILAELIVVAFHGVAAGDCLSRGRVSASGGKVFLWLLPVIGFVCGFLANMLLDIYSGENIGSAAWISAVYVIPQWFGPVLMGVSLFLPVKNREPKL